MPYPFWLKDLGVISFFLSFFPEITDVKNYVSNKNRLFFSSFGNWKELIIWKACWMQGFFILKCTIFKGINALSIVSTLQMVINLIGLLWYWLYYKSST